MNAEVINNLLDKLDTSVNSNSFWIELGIPKANTDLGQILVQHLKTGNFHFELMKQDIERGWEYYVETVFQRNTEQSFLIPRIGNTWNGTKEISYKEINRKHTSELLFDLLTGFGEYFSISSSGSFMNKNEAASIIDNLLSNLDRLDSDWKVFNIDPNFLNNAESFFDSGYVKLPYFEGAGRDLALCFLVDGELNILLTNGYN
ncbi:hypothetical protein [Flammeovirga kamogawensis]|uniref:Uncharacterized protein n=1 Tax=Flammeovirga kamogawensis TaxID=373891 RepID=A0ABX8H247_9BACT|nr:hypothetical protein [Flammeovirga kamogawensis]MBB6464142.1 hypothetical protein [Flammeovirga kamogawensis]QWG09900.1 hypothetical protein KM029_19660 [Flammeovirga kamogawensis]TRX65404.1 hypothetical protein EO216_23055 [Flammeovirga kamogawensis]